MRVKIPSGSNDLVVLSQLFSNTAGLRTLLNQSEDTGIEIFRDADEAAKQQESEAAALHSNAYDGRKRDPQHANARGSCLWELVCRFPRASRPRTYLLPGRSPSSTITIHPSPFRRDNCWSFNFRSQAPPTFHKTP